MDFWQFHIGRESWSDSVSFSVGMEPVAVDSDLDLGRPEVAGEAGADPQHRYHVDVRAGELQLDAGSGEDTVHVVVCSILKRIPEKYRTPDTDKRTNT